MVTAGSDAPVGPTGLSCEGVESLVAARPGDARLRVTDGVGGTWDVEREGPWDESRG